MLTWRGRSLQAQITISIRRFSAFIEYKYLDYTSTQIETNEES